jgi:tetratricopeptide (TPR) repeat protein
MACALCGEKDEGVGGLCPSCAQLSAPFTETFDVVDPKSDPPRDRNDPTSPVLKTPLPLPVRPASLVLGPGESFGERYKIVEEVGSGGMGQVYKAIDGQLLRAVALKLIKPDHAARTESLQRFQRELLLAQQVSHKNVCRVHDLGEVQGIRYISMEYIEGQTLEDLIRSVNHLSARQTVALGMQICAGLSAIHDRGIVHRDLKPGNIMVDRSGQALVTDFGMAYRPGEQKLTSAGAVLGTLAYLSPEHARGFPTDARSDIYALGIILFEMLTGRRPPADEVSLPLALREADTVCPPPSRIEPEVPPVLDPIVLRCLERDASRRYQTVAEVEKALEDAGTALSSSVFMPVPTAGAKPTPPRRAQRLAWSIAAGLGLLGAGYWAMANRPQPIVTLALLPLSYEGPDAHASFREFLPVVIGDALRSVPGLQVAPFASSRAFGPEEDPKSVAQALRVDNVVRGRVKVTQGRLETRLVVFESDGKERAPVSRTGDVAATADTASRLAAEIARAVGREPPAAKVRSARTLELYFEGKRLRDGWDVERNYEKAEKEFEQALAIDGSFAEARAGLALSLTSHYYDTFEPSVIERAGQEARRAVELDPSLPEAQLALGLVQLIRGQSVEAAVTLEKAQNLAPADDAVFRQIARAYERQSRFDEAERYFDRAIRLRPGFWENYSWMGGFHRRRGDLSRAKEYFGKVIELRPQSDVGYLSLARAYILGGEFDKAVPHLVKALELNPSHQAHTNLGVVYYALGDFEKAAQEFQAAIDAGQIQVESWGNLGDALRQLGRQRDANAAYAHALTLGRERLKVDPRDGEFRTVVAMFLAGASQCAEARAETARALGADSNLTPTAHSYAAIAYAVCGDRAAAIREAKKALEGGVMTDLRSNPDLKEVREDPSIRALLETPGGF